MNPTDTRRLQHIETALRKLGADQLAAVRQAVAARESEVEGALVIHQRAQAVTTCPHCGGRVIRWGSAKGVPRFKCRNDAKSPDGRPVCGRSFNALTGTPLARLQKAEHFIANAACMVAGTSVRATAARLGIDKTTAFRWRHRFLKLAASNPPRALAGIVEADETFVRRSYKGQRSNLPRPPRKRGGPPDEKCRVSEHQPILVARDRATGRTLSTLIESKSAVAIANALRPVLANDAELITDGASTYRTVATRLGVEQRTAIAGRRHKTIGTLHINNVNAYHARLKDWLRNFNGVATRHLGAYLGWHCWLDARAPETPTLARAFLRDALGPPTKTAQKSALYASSVGSTIPEG